jgi:heme/copper-type cytochrome/quinol oxidase subunit 1
MIKFSAYRWFFLTSIPFLILQAIFSIIWRTPSVPLSFHNTFYVISNSKILFLLAFFFVFIGIIYFVMEKMERQLHKLLNIVHYFITIISILILIFGMVISGFFVESYNTDVKAQLFDYKTLNKYILISGFLLLFGQLIFITNCMFGLFRRRTIY